ncbi:MAG: DUF5320 domain-containing protein [Lachnospiraceae bacterium]|nr:DUF5320 domain-containing protein [Lachnospiraceae bacterium]
MPRGDGTGPRGLGFAGMGRGVGCCTGFYANKYASADGFGYGFGKGYGLLRDQGFDEKELLENQAEFLENRLKLVKSRLLTLKKDEE